MKKNISAKVGRVLTLVLSGWLLVSCVPTTLDSPGRVQSQALTNNGASALATEAVAVSKQDHVLGFVDEQAGSASPLPSPALNTLSPDGASSGIQQLSIEIELVDTGLLAGGEGEGGGNFLNPVWSHDGTRLAYKYNLGIWVVDTQTWQNPQRIYGTQQSRADFDLIFEQSQNLVWSPDDRQIGFTLIKLPKEGHGAEPIMASFDLIENRASLLLEGVIGVLVDWGKRGIITCHYSEKGCAVVDLATRERQELGHVTSPFFYSENQISYARSGSIIIKDVEGEDAKEFTNANVPPPGQYNPFSVGSVPIASPDGNFFVWTYFEPDPHDPLVKLQRIELYSVNDQETIELLNSDDFPEKGWSLPAWSPDSQKLAFLAGGNIWIIHLKAQN